MDILNSNKLDIMIDIEDVTKQGRENEFPTKMVVSELIFLKRF